LKNHGIFVGQLLANILYDIAVNFLGGFGLVFAIDDSLFFVPLDQSVADVSHEIMKPYAAILLQVLIIDQDQVPVLPEWLENLRLVDYHLNPKQFYSQATFL
jgi:hypothetical protein